MRTPESLVARLMQCVRMDVFFIWLILCATTVRAT